MRSLYDNEKGKRIYLFRNGDSTFYGKPLVVNKRQIRNVDVLLNVATNHLHMPEQVRDIRTPDHGRFIIKSIDDLVEDQAYVAVGLGGFKRLPYTTLLDDHERKQQLMKRRRELIQRIPQRKGTATPVYLNTATHKEVIIICVYINGDEFTAGKKVVLRPRTLKNWNVILQEIDDALKPNFGPVTRLFTLEGQPVADQRSLETSKAYVAAGRLGSFKKVPYGNERKFVVAGRIREQPADSLFLTESTAAYHGETLTVGLSPRESSLSRQHPREPDNEHQSPILKYADGSEVFPKKPRRHRRKKKKKRDVGVFRMKTEREEVRGAKQVEEYHDPEYKHQSFSDINEADEVNEEEIEANRDDLGHRYQATPPPNPRPPGAGGNRRASRVRRALPSENRKRDSAVGPGSMQSEDSEEIKEVIEIEERGQDADILEFSNIDQTENLDNYKDYENDKRSDKQRDKMQETYEKKQREDEAARKIQKAYRANSQQKASRQHSDRNVNQENSGSRQHENSEEEKEELEQPNNKQSQRQEKQQDQDEELDSMGPSPEYSDRQQDGYSITPGGSSDPYLMVEESSTTKAQKQPNGQIKRSSEAQRRKV